MALQSSRRGKPSRAIVRVVASLHRTRYRARMAVAASSLLTKEDYRMLPETGPRYQLIEGELYMAPAPNRYHQNISRNIEFMLLKFLEKHPLGELNHAPFDVYLSEHDVFQPDIVYVTKENAAVLTDAGIEGTPDLVVEILSPGTAYLDNKSKPRVYARCGVKELWIVDPQVKLVHVYLLQKDSRRPMASHDEKATFTCQFFPGLKIRGKTIFKQ
jgi:Uma2 family endonuclease